MLAPMREKMSDGLIREWEVFESLWSGRTKFQQVDICKTAHGISLFCDEERQSCEKTQLIYHEAMTYPALFYCQYPENVLILGSSEGVATQIVSKFCHPQDVVHVDIDEECVRLCAEHLPYGYTLEDVDRLVASGNLIFQDGKKYLEENRGRWDIILMDLPDEQEEEAPQNNLYTEDFFTTVRARLSKNGMFLSQAGCPTAWRSNTLQFMLRRFKSAFYYWKYFDMPEHEWAWMLGSQSSELYQGTPAYPSGDNAPQHIHRKSLTKHFSLPSSLQ